MTRVTLKGIFKESLMTKLCLSQLGGLTVTRLHVCREEKLI